MTLFNTSYNRNILGSLYSARGKLIRKREEFLKKFGPPPSQRVWFEVKETKDTIALHLNHSKFTTIEDREYVDKISTSLLIAA